MSNIQIIEESLPQTLTLAQRVKVRQMARALELLKEVQDYTESKFLIRAEIEELKARIERFLQYMRQNMPQETVKQKGHMLFRHALQFTEQWGNLAWFSEQGIESLHGMYRKQAKRYKMVDLRKQTFMMKWNFSQVILEASRPTPEDAEEYDFREEPAYFGEDGEDEE